MENNVAFPSVNQRQIGVINTTEFEVADFLTLKNIFSYQSNSRRGNSAQNVDSLYLPMLELVDGPGQGPRALTEEVQAQASQLDERSEERCGGKECVRKGRKRVAQCVKKNKTK